MVPTPNRFDNVATAAGSGVDVDTIIEILATPQAEFGDLDGDTPRSAGRAEDEVGTSTLKETLDFYDQGRPEGIQINSEKN